jgi:hypothetical protein
MHKTAIGYDVDGVLLWSPLDRRKYRPFRLHEYFRSCERTPLIPEENAEIYIITGRREKFRKVTEQTLTDIIYKKLIMFPPKVKKDKDTFIDFKVYAIRENKIGRYYEDDVGVAIAIRSSVRSCEVIYVDRDFNMKPIRILTDFE